MFKNWSLSDKLTAFVTVTVTVALIAMLNMGTNGDGVSPSPSKKPSTEPLEAARDIDGSETSATTTGNLGGGMLLPKERETWAKDPNSYGFSDEDRAFLDEHGVSESEARAMETIMRQNGVD